MTDEELFDYLDGMYAYDTGMVDCGIKDEITRYKIIDAFKADPDWAMRKLNEYVKEYYFGDNFQGRGLESVRGFINWLDERMGFYV